MQNQELGKVLGPRVKQARAFTGKTQQQLATEVGVSPFYLSRVEKGHNMPALDTLAAIAKITRFPLWWFFFERDLPIQKIAQMDAEGDSPLTKPELTAA